jgi:hypothetical protein
VNWIINADNKRQFLELIKMVENPRSSDRYLASVGLRVRKCRRRIIKTGN